MYWKRHISFRHYATTNSTHQTCPHTRLKNQTSQPTTTTIRKSRLATRKRATGTKHQLKPAHNLSSNMTQSKTGDDLKPSKRIFNIRLSSGIFSDTILWLGLILSVAGIVVITYYFTSRSELYDSRRQQPTVPGLISASILASAASRFRANSTIVITI